MEFGRVVCAFEDERGKKWFPAMIVNPRAQKGCTLSARKEYCVRSFKDGR